jgi:hypothetical protein
MNTFSFNERLEWSFGQLQADDIATIKTILTGCTNVRKTTPDQDRSGIDYIATLRHGAEVLVDAKNRAQGCSKFWKPNTPEFALERWSVVPSLQNHAKPGWTLSTASPVHYILFKFHPSDWPFAYLVSFQLLRVAFYRNCNHWFKIFKHQFQSSGSWQSEAVFVPVKTVFEAMSIAATTGKTPQNPVA